MKKPTQTTWIVAGLSAALVIAVGGFAISQLPPPVTGGVADSSQGSSASHSPSGSAGESSDGSGGSGSGSGGGSHVNAPPTAGKRYTTEVIPANPTPAAPALPPTTALPSPVTAPLPTTATATGRLVAGFPASAVPAAPGSTVASSSVASQGAHLQVTLVAKTAQAVTDIVAFYRTALAKYGMYDAPAPAAAGSTAVAFSRVGNSVTVTATPGAGGTSYVVYGTFTVTS